MIIKQTHMCVLLFPILIVFVYIE